MKQIKVNPNNEQFYSKEFIRGFNLGAERQYEADRPKGKWIEESDNHGHSSYFCSRCGTQEGEPSGFCPNCGARMSEIPTGSERSGE